MSRVHCGGTNPSRDALIAYASGHIVAATTPAMSVHRGRSGIIKPTKRIQGPTAEMPSTGRSAASGTDVSTSAIANATSTSNARPSMASVEGRTSSYRNATTSPAVASATASVTSRMTGSAYTRPRSGCAICWNAMTTRTSAAIGRKSREKGGGGFRSTLAGAWCRRVASSGGMRVPLNGSGLSIPVSIVARPCPQAARPAAHFPWRSSTSAPTPAVSSSSSSTARATCDC